MGFHCGEREGHTVYIPKQEAVVNKQQCTKQENYFVQWSLTGYKTHTYDEASHPTLEGQQKDELSGAFKNLFCLHHFDWILFYLAGLCLYTMV